MEAFTQRELEEALAALGELVESRGEAYELVVIGGGSLLLQGHLRRVTQDLDVVAQIREGGYVSAEPLPEGLLRAVREVAGVYALGEKWLNAGPTDLLQFGLPEGFSQRKETRSYGTLTIHLAGRLDQIAFKLYAAVDQGPRSKHFRDLQELTPGRDELLVGARWAMTHDGSPAFKDQLEQALQALGVDDAEIA